MNFGENLKFFRKNCKMSQEVLAEKVGVSRQAVSRWEVGEAYPEMSNIIALCSIFRCNINDLLNDNIVSIESFDKETQEGIVKFKKNQQKKMKSITKIIYIIANVTKTMIAILAMFLIITCFVFLCISNTFEINENKIKILNKEYNYSVNKDILTINDNNYYIEAISNLNEFVNTHSKTFLIISVECVLVNEILSLFLIALFLHYLSVLYKNIYNDNTPFTFKNEKIIHKAFVTFLIALLLRRGAKTIYLLIAGLDLSLNVYVKDLIIILVGVSVIYIFKYGRLIQTDTKARIYD